MSGAWTYGNFPEGSRAHVVQVGLGDNRTFLHDWGDSNPNLGWLLSAVSRDRDFCGVAVEPVWKHLEAAYHLAKDTRYDYNVALVQAALGEYTGRTLMYRVEELSQKELQCLDPAAREDYELQMSYLRNMSCVEELSDWLRDRHHILEEQLGPLGVHVPITEDVVPLWTWERLVEELGFKGCEVLIIDTEGFDVEILRSLAAYCADRLEELPWVIQFESNGLCNARAGYNCEWYIIPEFEKLGYTLLARGRDTYLVLKTAESASLNAWLDEWACVGCGCRESPYTLTPDPLCESCAKSLMSKTWSDSQGSCSGSCGSCDTLEGDPQGAS